MYSALDHQRVLEGLWAILNRAVFLLPHGGLCSNLWVLFGDWHCEVLEYLGHLILVL